MGRGLGVTHRILARSCPLMVSRNHCTFRITSEGHCLVVDNQFLMQSLNGVWVNGERIEPQQVHRLSEGDVIRLGVPLRDKERAEYEYRLTWRDREQEEAGSRGTARTKDSVRVKRKHSCDQVEPLDTDGAQCYTNKIQRLCQSNTSENCTSRDGQRLTAGTDPGPSRDGQRLTAGTDPGPSRDGHRLTAGTDPGPSRDGQRLTAGTDPGPSMMRKTCIQSCPSGTLRAIPGVQADGLSVPGENDSHVEELAAGVQGLQELQGKLHKSLPTEQQERKELKAALSRQRKELEDIIRAKDRELQERKVKVHRDQAAAQLTDVLENELQCIICSEHFIEAVTLNCSHSFCCHCILEWRKRKEWCPICRQTIQTQSRSVVLDNCIERMLENLSEAMRQRRLQLLKQRKALKMKPVSVPDSESSSCDDLTSIQSVSTLDSSELEEHSDEGDTEDNSPPVYYSI